MKKLFLISFLIFAFFTGLYSLDNYDQNVINFMNRLFKENGMDPKTADHPKDIQWTSNDKININVMVIPVNSGKNQ
jgi:hypothetical protein